MVEGKKSKMKKIGIIGAGRLGTSLGYALTRAGYAVKAVSTGTLSSAEESRNIIGQGIALTDNVRTAGSGEIVILSVPDDSISQVVKELDAADLEWKGKLVFHCSGLHPSRLLRPLGVKGALIASIHPSQSFPQKSRAPKAFRGVYFAIEGEAEALAIARIIILDLGGHPFIIQKEDKVLYHAACSIASNFFVALLDGAITLLQGCGLKEETGRDILLPLVERTLRNVKKFNTSAALSGPIIRGDHKTVKIHLQALREHPEIYRIYVSLASQALEIARRGKKITSAEDRAIKALLEQ